MSFSQICPVCKAPEVVQSVWSSQCLSCGSVFHDEPEAHVPDADPGVTTPVRPGHSLISSAAPTHVGPAAAPPAPPSEVPVAEATAEVK